MQYSNAKMTGSVSQPASGAAAGSRPAPGGAVSDIIMAVTERQIAPGETACFPFAARTAYGIPSIHDFNVISDNPDFNPEWVRLRRSAGDSYGPHYILEITPGDIGRSQYGAYPLRLSWGEAGTYRYAGGRCTLIVRPCVRAVTEPAVKIWPAGQVEAVARLPEGLCQVRHSTHTTHDLIARSGHLGMFRAQIGG